MVGSKEYCNEQKSIQIASQQKLLRTPIKICTGFPGYGIVYRQLK